MNLHDLNIPALVHQGTVILLVLLMFWVIVSDVTRYIIPNTLNLAVIALFGLGIFFLPIEPLTAVAAAALVLLVGLGFFALGLMGGGDIKLLVGLTLWTGWSVATAQFLFLTAVMGGVLVLIVLPARWLIPPIMFRANPTRTMPRILTRKQPVPYGVAIAMAFLFLLYSGGIPVLH